MKNKFLKSQKGVSLIELILAMGVGLILLLALGGLMVTANKSAAQRSLSESANEIARQVITRLENNLLMAGYIDPFSDLAERMVFLDVESSSDLILKYAKHKDRGGKADANNPSAAATPSSTPSNQFSLIREVTGRKIEAVKGCSGGLNDVDGQLIDCDNSSDPQSKQSIIIGFEAIKAGEGISKYTALLDIDQEGKIDTGSNRVCNTQTGLAAGDIKNGQSLSIITNAYSVDNDNNLACNGRLFGYEKDIATGKNKQEVIEGKSQSKEPLVNGVDQLTFRYLMTKENGRNTEDMKIGADPEGRTVARYVQPHKVNSIESGNLGWSGVIGVEVCLVVGIDSGSVATYEEMLEFQPKIPQCLREDATNKGYYPHSPFVNTGNDRKSGDNKFYRRYVRTIMLPNNLNLTSNII